MKKNNKKFLLILFVLLLAVCGYNIFLFYSKISHPAQKPEIDSLKYEELLSAKDASPIQIPKDLQKQKIVKIPILMYHHVGDLPKDASPTRKDLTVDPKDFEDQVKWLSEQGYQSMSLNWLLLRSQNRKNLNAVPTKPVIFTFDDGYDDVFRNAIPVLQKYGFVGSFAIITSYPGQTQGTNFYASWPEIAKAYSDGMEIVCHTQNHFDGTNTKYSAEYIYNNLLGCKQDLKNHLGIDSNVLIYPYGHYNNTYIEQAKKAGFNVGVTVHEGDLINLDDLMQVPRLRIHANENFEKFKKLITQ